MKIIQNPVEKSLIFKKKLNIFLNQKKFEKKSKFFDEIFFEVQLFCWEKQFKEVSERFQHFLSTQNLGKIYFES